MADRAYIDGGPLEVAANVLIGLTPPINFLDTDSAFIYIFWNLALLFNLDGTP